jgi:sugar phosphate isomerase/epimerase
MPSRWRHFATIEEPSKMKNLKSSRVNFSNNPIGLFSLSSPTLTNLEGVAEVAAFHLSAFEPLGGQSDLLYPNQTVGLAIRHEAEIHHISLPCFSLVSDLTKPHEKERIEGFLHLAKAMGIPLFHHTLYPELDPTKAKPSRDFFSQAVILERSLYDEAKALGIRLVYEEQGFLFNGHENYLAFLKALERPAGVLFDMGNVAFVEEKASTFLQAVLPRVVHVHCKDYALNGPEKPHVHHSLHHQTIDPVPLGQGDIGPEVLLVTLQKSGYSGAFMLEQEERSKAAMAEDIITLQKWLSKGPQNETGLPLT